MQESFLEERTQEKSQEARPEFDARVRFAEERPVKGPSRGNCWSRGRGGGEVPLRKLLRRQRRDIRGAGRKDSGSQRRRGDSLVAWKVRTVKSLSTESFEPGRHDEEQGERPCLGDCFVSEMPRKLPLESVYEITHNHVKRS